MQGGQIKMTEKTCMICQIDHNKDYMEFIGNRYVCYGCHTLLRENILRVFKRYFKKEGWLINAEIRSEMTHLYNKFDALEEAYRSLYGIMKASSRKKMKKLTKEGHTIFTNVEDTKK